jgi:hypothetical protein
MWHRPRFYKPCFRHASNRAKTCQLSDMMDPSDMELQSASFHIQYG